jgi:hypothetical protein
MTLSTWFEGDPESCWRVARRLDSLAETMEQTGRFLGHQASLPADEFEGLSGNAYRASAGTLRDEAVDAATAQRALASALDEFATNLDGVRRVLRRARALARDHLVIHGLEIQEPGAYADERQREVFAMVEGVVHEARRIEHRAHHDWQAALAEHAGTAALSPLATGPSGLPLLEPDPVPHPDPEPEPEDGPQPQPPGGGAAASSTAPATTTTPAATPAATPAPVVAPEDDWRQPSETDWLPTPAPVPTTTPAPAPEPELIEWELTDGPR